MQYSFDEYDLVINSNKKSNKLRVVFISIIIGITIIMCSFKFSIYEKYLLYYEDGNYYLLVELNKQCLFKEKGSFLINGAEYKYSINSTNSDYMNMNNTIYKSINIEIEKYDSRDRYTYIDYLYKSNTLINMIFEFLDGGKHD